MNLFEVIILNVIYITFPLSIYLFYVAYNKNHGRGEIELFLDLSLFSSVYMVLRFGEGLFGQTAILFANVPLLIAYIKNRKTAAIVLSIILIIQTSNLYNFPIIYIIIEYVVYFISYMIAKRYHRKEYHFIIYFMLLKSIVYLIVTENYGVMPLNYNVEQLKDLIISLTYYVISLFSIAMFQKGEDVLKYHHTLKELEQDKQVRDSLFKITHEIKNPIAVCKGYLDMFDVNNPEHSRKYIPIIKEEIARTLLLLQDFLSMRKIKINKEPMDIELLIEDVMESFSSMLIEHDIDYDINIGDNEIYINGDYNRLCQVFINVIKNSIESFSGDNHYKINISLIEEDDVIKIIIEDNGSGITPENLSKIKEPFFTTKKQGTGLGVALSHEIIKQHDGKLDYDSKWGFGTTVTVTLPKLKED